jgi:type II secretory pathway pseudopilin PulG
MAAGPDPDSGFSLVEVVVAIGLLMLVMVALLPQMVLGISATGTARLVTQAKGVAQGQLEKMRNLPYHISPEAGDYRDVLDTYYRNVTAPSPAAGCTVSAGKYAVPRVAWTGFVEAGDAARCDYEPTGGAFYRTVTAGPTSPAGLTSMILVDTAFLSGVTPGLGMAPPTTYDSQVVARSQPVSSQIGVTVTVVYTDRGVVRVATTATQISDRPTTTERIRAESSVTAVEAGSETIGNGPASLSAGVLNLAGSLTYASTVNASLAGTSASVATGDQAGGATASVAVPPTTTARSVLENAGILPGPGCVIACWGSTELNVPAMSASGGLPQAGSQAARMQALLTSKGNDGLSFGNSALEEYRTGLKLRPPLVRLDSSAAPLVDAPSLNCAAGTPSTSSYVAASGYLLTTGVADSVAPGTVESCAVARTSTIALFPTDFAPQGVVVVELLQARARCTVSGVNHAASVDHGYSAVVRYWNGTAYTTLPTISQASGTDPLDAIDLATTSVGGGLFLGDFVDSWSSLRSPEVTAKAAGGIAELELPGVVTIASQPTRLGAALELDPTSVVSITLGAVACAAEDQR